MAIEEQEIDKKLKADNPDLRSILDDILCLQEIRNNNEQLINFLKREDNFRTIVGAILVPVQDEEEGADSGAKQLKEKYRFVHQCSEVLCIGAQKFYPEFAKHEDLLPKLANFLADNPTRLNPLVVSLYSRVVMTFLSVEPEKFLDVLKNSKFLDSCLDGLEYSALFELLCTVANCAPDPVHREMAKKWYVDQQFAAKMLELLRPDRPSAMHENVAQVWIEFVRSLRDYQYNVEQVADPLLESIQSEEVVAGLLGLMFPKEEDGGCICASVVANGAWILNVLLETNPVRNSPSQLVAHEQQNMGNAGGGGGTNSSLDPLLAQQNFSFNSTDNTSYSAKQELMDPHRVVETRCAEHAADLVHCVLYALGVGSQDQLKQQRGDGGGMSSMAAASAHASATADHGKTTTTPERARNKLVDYPDTSAETCADKSAAPNSSQREEEAADEAEEEQEQFYGDVLHQCMQLLINLTNTNFLPTHLELLNAFQMPPTALAKLFAEVSANPSRSIFNSQLKTMVLHILYSNTGSTQRPLVDFLIKDFNLSACIANSLSPSNEGKQPIDQPAAANPLTSRLSAIAKRSFFLQLGRWLNQAQQTSPNAEHIETLMKELANYEHWQEFCSQSVQSFIDQNRSEKVNNLTATMRTSCAIEIDELPPPEGGGGAGAAALKNLNLSIAVDGHGQLFNELRDLELEPNHQGGNRRNNKQSPVPDQSEPEAESNKHDDDAHDEHNNADDGHGHDDHKNDLLFFD